MRVRKSDPDDPNRELFETDGLLPGPDATLAGPTFEEWLDSTSDAPRPPAERASA
jgi:hypothetical protein